MCHCLPHTRSMQRNFMLIFCTYGCMSLFCSFLCSLSLSPSLALRIGSPINRHVVYVRMCDMKSLVISPFSLSFLWAIQPIDIIRTIATPILTPVIADRKPRFFSSLSYSSSNTGSWVELVSKATWQLPVRRAAPRLFQSGDEYIHGKNGSVLPILIAADLYFFNMGNLWSKNTK